MRAPDLSPEQLARDARTCSVLGSAQTLAQWVGDGRAVTARGVLKPAAAVEVCALLDIEVPSLKPRSALDIDELMMVWAVASEAGFIEVSGGRVMAGPGLQPWLDGAPGNVLAVWSRCVLESFGLVDEMDEDNLEYLAVLVALDSRGGMASLGELSAGIAELTGDGSSDCPCPDCASRPQYPGESDLGADEEAQEAVQALGEFGVAVLRGDVAELTPLGRWFTDFMFRESAPSADADARFLVSELAQLPDMVAALMARPWLSSRAPVAAARELLVVGGSTAGQERLTALALVRECGSAAAPAWREWAAKDGFGAYARVWLAEQDDTEPADADTAWITVDGLAILLDALPPELSENLLPGLLEAQLGAEIADALPLLESCDHPASPRLVELLAGVDAFARAPVLRVIPGGLRETQTRPVPRRRREHVGAGYEIKIQLCGVLDPPVWRRLHVPADLTLYEFHDVIQVAMGWDDSHLHVFADGRNEYGLPDYDLGHRDERKVRLSQVLTNSGDKLRYTYDFGDNWQHDIILEKILPADAGVTGPICAAGKGACPPEDCGGVGGYERLKATLADPGAKEHDDMLEWLGLASGDDFDPNEFSAKTVNRRLGGSA